MTGYGKSASTIGSRRYTAEVRSLNGKQLDLSVRMPQAFREKEMELRKLLSSAIVRGKSDINLHYEADATDQRELNIPLIEHYLTHLEKLADKKGYEKDALLLGTAMRLPDTVQQSREEINEDEWKQIRRLVEEAVSQFLEFRIQEGKTMEMDLRGRVEQILELESKLDPLLTERIERVRDRIQANFDEIKDRGRLDENRFEQEVLFYIEKMDVSEERVRLKAHWLSLLKRWAGKSTRWGARPTMQKFNDLWCR